MSQSQPQPQSKADALFSLVRSDILTLDLPPNQPLRLPALSERYAIGLTPLRECLNRLCGDRLVIPEHNKGFRVAPLTRTDLLDLERSRAAIEGTMFAFSAAHRSDSWEAGVVGAFHHLSQTPVPPVLLDSDHLSLWNRRHRAFHAALVAGSPSVWMHRFARQIDDQLGRYHRFIQNGLRDLAGSSPSVAKDAADVFATAMALDPHQALLDAALAPAPEAARAAFEAHVGLSIAAFEGLTAMMPTDTSIATILGDRPQAPTPLPSQQQAMP